MPGVSTPGRIPTTCAHTASGSTLGTRPAAVGTTLAARTPERVTHVAEATSAAVGVVEAVEAVEEVLGRAEDDTEGGDEAEGSTAVRVVEGVDA